MKDGTCPRCGKREVRVSDGRSNGAHPLLATVFTSTRPLTYVCVGCGYTEQWVTDRKFLAKVAEKWARVR